MTTLQHTQRYRAGGLGPGPDLGPTSNAQGLYGATPPALSSVLFDFDPAFSLTEDRIGGLSLTNTGSVTKVIANGRVAAEFDGSNNLASSGSPFTTLSDLTGGCTVYVVCERTDALTTQKSVMGIDKLSDTAAKQSVYLAQNDNGTLVAGMVDSGSILFDTEAVAVGSRNLVQVISGSYTTTALTARRSGYGSSSAIASTDPTGLDQVLIGVNGLNGLSGDWVGRVYRVLICEGAHDQAIADYLADLYTPLRLPPGLDASDVLAVWDARHNPFRDTLNGVDLTVVGTPTVVSSAGDVAMRFVFASSQYLHGTITEQDLDEDLCIYCVQSNDGAGTSGISHVGGFYDASSPDTENFHAQSRIVAGGGSSLTVEEAGVAAGDFSGATAVVDKIQLIACHSIPETEIQCWLDGYNNGGTTAHSLTPRNIDQWRIGLDSTSTLYPTGDVFYWIAVKAQRAAEVETWLNAVFPVGRAALPAPTGLEFDLDANFYPTDPADATEDWAAYSTDATPTVTTGYGSEEFDWDAATTASLAKVSTVPFADHSAEIPYTIYAVVTPSAVDIAGTTMFMELRQDNSNLILVQCRASGDLWIVVTAGGANSSLTANTNLVAGTTYVLAFEFTSLTEFSVWVDGTEYNSGAVTSRDPGTFGSLIFGRTIFYGGGSFPFDGSIHRAFGKSGAYDADIEAYLTAEYL